MKGSTLYSYIESLQGETPYGRVLDAGTGPRSLLWLMTLDTDSCTAVTAAAIGLAEVRRHIGEWERPQDRMLVGNWTDPGLLGGEEFDTVFADYLLGAVERSAPFFQTALFPRLRPLTLKRIYVTGMEPYVVQRPRDDAGALIWEIGRYRDACMILTGRLPFREYPLEWVVRELKRAGFEPIATRKFPLAYKADFVNGQIDMARSGVEKMPDQALARALIANGDALRERALEHIEQHGALDHGFAHVIAANPV
jgi:hypothetical protein